MSLGRALAPLTPRQQHEKAHYDERYRTFLRSVDGNSPFVPKAEALHVMVGSERRPFNQDWEFLHTIRDLELSGKTVLEIGCGTGEYAVLFAALGARVVAIDLSEQGIEIARARARYYDLDDRISFHSIAVESMDFPDESFDAVVGSYIIHHIEIESVARHLHRILKPGGVGVFLEWVQWKPFDTLRSSRLLRMLFPPGKADVTQDERKLDDKDLDVFRRYFRRVDAVRFYTLARLCYFFPNHYSRIARIDYGLYRVAPVLRKAGGAAIITMRK